MHDEHSHPQVKPEPSGRGFGREAVAIRRGPGEPAQRPYSGRRQESRARIITSTPLRCVEPTPALWYVAP